jgi:hypothetical protein
MTIKLKDNLVHATQEHESKDRYGKTVCQVSYTTDPVHVRVINNNVYEDTAVAKTAKPPLTCLLCIARSTA